MPPKKGKEVKGKRKQRGLEQTTMSLVNDDSINQQLNSLYLSSFAMDVRALKKSEWNHALNHNLIQKLKELFKLGARQFSQEDCLQVTMTSDTFNLIMQQYFSVCHPSIELESSNGEEIMAKILQKACTKTSQAVSCFLSSNHG